MDTLDKTRVSASCTEESENKESLHVPTVNCMDDSSHVSCSFFVQNQDPYQAKMLEKASLVDKRSQKDKLLWKPGVE